MKSKAFNTLLGQAGIAANPPKVTKSRLQGIIKTSTSSPEPSPKWATVRSAPRSSTSCSWHAGDAADHLIKLTRLLEDDRKQNNGLLTDRERRIALSEAQEIWDVMDNPDATGKVKAFIKGNKEINNAVKKSITRCQCTVAGIGDRR
ncbi:hypothetical protein [Streptomyces sp. SA15]|uniref:hypothetical protein n=1 Tax=Streptomyces sp. SA15 TaxID=934019 RepID=UPI00117E1E98|nr:hypothetical protein [Streptomyces sp. SA15]